MLNQLLWFVLAVMTLGLIALAWKKPISEKIMPALAAVPQAVEAKPAESTLMIVRVRKVHAPRHLVS